MSPVLKTPLRAAVMPGIVGLALLLAGCGDGESPDRADRGERVVTDDASTQSSGVTSAAALREVVTDTTTADSGRLQLTMSMTGEGAPEEDFTVSGEFAGDTTHLTMDFGALLGADDDASTDLDDRLFSTTEMITSGDDMYLKGGMASIFGATGDRWLKLADSDLAGAGRSLFGATQSVDPEEFLALLNGADDEIEQLGEEDVRGETCDHLRVTTSFADVVEGAAEESAEDSPEDVSELREFLEGDFGAATDGDIPVDVWVCDDGRIHKMTMTMDGAAMGDGSDAGGFTMTMELYDLGEDVAIEIPTDVEELDLGSMLGGVGDMLDDFSGFDPGGDTTD